MNARSVEVLHSIVVAYIESGEPVASKDVVLKKAPHRAEGAALSPATIRNIMAELTVEGYLSQPHTSAGRVPTHKAFQHYIQSLATGRLVNAELERIRSELRRAQTVGNQLERSSAVLSGMTRGVGIAAAIPASSQKLEQVELLLLPDRRVLMIVVTGDRMVRQQVVALDSKVTQDELTSIRNYLNRNFGGWMLDDARRELERRLEQEQAAYDAILKTLTGLYNQGLLDFGLEPEIHFDGASNLVGLDVNLTSETLRELLAALEEKQRILSLLERFLEEPSGQIAMQLGLGDVHPAMQDVALIGITVALPDGMSTKLAVLGPLRMNYNRAISAIRHVGTALDGLDR
jgi:heat-inducible transcriptional repressor